MGKNLIIHHDEIGARYHHSQSCLLLTLFELTKAGARDISHKVFGNVAGENILVPKDKVIFAVVSHKDSAGYIYKALGRLYDPIYDRAAGEDRNNITTLQKDLSTEMSQKKISREWKKDKESNSSREYYPTFFRYGPYSDIIQNCMCYVSHPDEMSEEELEDTLSIYGGVDNFDVRPFIFGDDLQNQGPSLQYAVNSRSYILQSPLIFPASKLQSMLFLGKALVDSESRKNVEATAIYMNVQTSPISWALSFYKACRDTLYLFHRDVLDIHRLLINISTLSNVSEVIEELISRGSISNPGNPSRLVSSQIGEVLRSVRDCRSISSSQLVHNATVTNRFSDEELSVVELSLVKAARTMLNRLATVVNSTVYLTKDLMSMTRIDAEKNVRWKGSRRDQEKYLAGCILGLKAVLSTPPLVKKLLSGGTFLTTSKQSILPKMGALIECVTGRKNSLCLDVSTLVEPDEVHLLKGGGDRLPKIHYEWVNWRAVGDRRLLVLYLFTGEVRYLKHALKHVVEELDDICTNLRVKNSLEAMFQIPAEGKMFMSKYNNSLQHGFVLESLELTSRTEAGTLLDSIEVLARRCIQEGIDVSEEIASVKLSIKSLLFIKHNLPLKAADYYTLDLCCDRLLSPTSWDLLVGNK